jgi:putative Holliday junction resolvase
MGQDEERTRDEIRERVDTVRRLGVDPGGRRIGLALSEPGVDVAYPYKTVEHGGLEQAVSLLAEEIRTNGVQEVVIGLPLRTDGRQGDAARRARQLGRMVERSASTKVVLWDERLSTAAAQRSLDRAGVRGKRRREAVDQVAATLILQSYLDSRSDSAGAERADELPAPQAVGEVTRSKARRGARRKKTRTKGS